MKPVQDRGAVGSKLHAPPLLSSITLAPSYTAPSVLITTPCRPAVSGNAAFESLAAGVVPP